MMMKVLISLAMSFLLMISTNILAMETQENEIIKDTTEICEKDKLVVVWTSGDKEVALKMVFMYTYNAKKYEWWKDITLLVWGPSAKLLSEDKELQKQIKEMSDIGINILACKGCADQYGVSDKLEEIGVTVKYTGVDLTNFIKDRHVITF